MGREDDSASRSFGLWRHEFWRSPCGRGCMLCRRDRRREGVPCVGTRGGKFETLYQWLIEKAMGCEGEAVKSLALIQVRVFTMKPRQCLTCNTRFPVIPLLLQPHFAPFCFPFSVLALPDLLQFRSLNASLLTHQKMHLCLASSGSP